MMDGKQQVSPSQIVSQINVALQRNQMKFDEINEAFEFIKQGMSMLLAMHTSEKMQLEEKVKLLNGTLKQYDDFLVKNELTFKPEETQPQNP